MRLVVLLLATFFCAFEAAKYKFSVTAQSTRPYIVVLHDINAEVVSVGGTPSAGWVRYLNQGNPDLLIAELRVMSGVFADTVQSVGAGGGTFYVQGDNPASMFTLIGVVNPAAGTFWTITSRVPLESVTDYSSIAVSWVVSGNMLMHTPDVASVKFTGRRVCPDNDAVVYLKLASVDQIFSSPIVWTQGGGTNDVFWNGQTLAAGSRVNTFFSTGSTTGLDAELLQNEDVCYFAVATSQIEAGGNRVWSIPVAPGQKVFFAIPGSPSSLIAPMEAGLTVWNVNGNLVNSMDVSEQLTNWRIVGGKVASNGAVSSLNAFVFDHMPTGNEFVEEEESLIDLYPFGECGSYTIDENGMYQPSEWTKHPYDCTDQEPTHSKCMFCKGRANGKVRSVCLDRMGATCNGAFNSAPTSAFCNLEFECPASTISFPIFLVLSLICVLFYGF